MFYFNEIKFRLNYLFLSFFLITNIFYFYGDLLFFLLSNKIVEKTLDRTQAFSYSNPIDLLDLYMAIVLNFSILFFAYQLSYQILDFLKSGLILAEYFFLSKNLIAVFAFFYYLNFFLCFNFSIFWTSFITTVDASELLFFELTFIEFFTTLKLLVSRANLCFFIAILSYIPLIFFELQIIFYFYKFYLLFDALLIFFFTHSMVFWQIYALVFLFFFLEFVFFLNVLKYKINKYLTLSSRHYIK
jgi:hypothetical protein